MAVQHWASVCVCVLLFAFMLIIVVSVVMWMLALVLYGTQIGGGDGIGFHILQVSGLGIDVEDGPV